MTASTESVLPGLPMQRPDGRPFDPPAELARIREEQPLRRMLFPDGHIGWLATGHAQVRAVLCDQRFSARYEVLHLPYSIPGAAELPAAAPGDLSGVDAPQHPLPPAASRQVHGSSDATTDRPHR